MGAAAFVVLEGVRREACGASREAWSFCLAPQAA